MYRRKILEIIAHKKILDRIDISQNRSKLSSRYGDISIDALIKKLNGDHEQLVHKIQNMDDTPNILIPGGESYTSEYVRKQCSTNVPFLLFPVRLEVKFHVDHGCNDPYQFWVRIFPDDIHVQTHEPDITEQEYDDLRLYRDMSADINNNIDGEFITLKKYFTSFTDDEIRIILNDENHLSSITEIQKTKIENYKNNVSKLNDDLDSAWKTLAESNGILRSKWLLNIDVDSNEFGPFNINSNGMQDTNKIYLKPSSWSNSHKIYTMPDKFVLHLYRKNNQNNPESIVGNTIPTPLILTPEPYPIEKPNDPVKSMFDKNSRWIDNFDESVNVGMGFKIPITYDDYMNGFDKIIVLGVKASANPEFSKKLLCKLIEGHQYSNGFSFMKQGTPTNNTSKNESGFSSDEDPITVGEYKHDYKPLLNANMQDYVNGMRFSKFLGLPWTLFKNTIGADDTEYHDSYAMNRALWNSTMGYWLDKILKPLNNDHRINGDYYAKAEDHFCKFVIARGPLAAFRVGTIPYSVLITTNFSPWNESQFDFHFTNKNDRTSELYVNKLLYSSINKLFPMWKKMSTDSNKVPRIGFSSDPQSEFIQILLMDAGCNSINIRNIVNKSYIANFSTLIQSRISFPQNILRFLFKSKSTGFFSTNMSKSINKIHQKLINEKLEKLTGIKGIRNLLSHMISSDQSYLMDKPLVFDEKNDFNVNMINYMKNYYHDVDINTIKSNNNGTSLFDDMIRNSIMLQVYDKRNVFVNSEFWISRYIEYLHNVGKIDPERLKRAFTEHIDLCTHRLDAYMTSMPIKRIEGIRNDVKNSTGIYLGAYGWLFDITQKTENKNGGYVHAPSIQHASAAAILRSSYLNRSDDNDESMSVNISSDRTRISRWLLEGVKNGQQLHVLLGYQFERGLRENSTTNHDLRSQIHIFRNLYPINLDSSSNSSINTVHGLNLLQDWRSQKNQNSFRYGASDVHGTNLINYMRRLSKPVRDSIESVLNSLDNSLDAVHDLELSESIFQILNKNYESAASSLDTISDGNSLSEPKIIKTPRSGTVLQHTFSALFNEKDITVDDLDPLTFSPRQYVAPHIDAWAQEILNDKKIVIKVKYDMPVLNLESVFNDSIDVHGEGNKQFILPIIESRDINFINMSNENGFKISVILKNNAHDANTINLKINGNDIQSIEINANSEKTFLIYYDEQWNITYNLADIKIIHFFELDMFLNAMNLGPIDLLYMANSGLNVDTDIVNWLSHYVEKTYEKKYGQKLHKKIIFEFDYKESPQSFSFQNFMMIYKRMQQLISNVRSLRPSDLQHSESETQNMYNADIFYKFHYVIEYIEKMLDDGEINMHEKLISFAKFGIINSVPTSAVESDDEQHDVTVNYNFARIEMKSRYSAAKIYYKAICDECLDGEPIENMPDIINEKTIDNIISGFKALFGKSFVIMPSFTLKNNSEIFDSKKHFNPPVSDIQLSIQKLARINTKIKQFESFALLQSIFNDFNSYDNGHMSVAQLPFENNDKWVFEHIADSQTMPAFEADFSYIFYSPTGAIESNESLLGIVFDTWNEVIPQSKETTAVSFNYNAPSSEPPHNILLVPSPVIDNNKGWNWDHLLGTIEDTINMAKIRAVDLHALKNMGYLFPALYLPSHLFKFKPHYSSKDVLGSKNFARDVTK